MVERFMKTMGKVIKVTKWEIKNKKKDDFF